MSVYQSAYLSFFLSIYIYLSFHIFLSIHRPLSLHLFIFRSFFPFLSQSYLLVNLSLKFRPPNLPLPPFLTHPEPAYLFSYLFSILSRSLNLYLPFSLSPLPKAPPLISRKLIFSHNVFAETVFRENGKRFFRFITNVADE